jgi:hypothetical protein
MAEGVVFADISMSLDGFITGPNDSVEKPLGEGAVSEATPADSDDSRDGAVVQVNHAVRETAFIQ